MASMISVYAWLQGYISFFKDIKDFNANIFVAQLQFFVREGLDSDHSDTINLDITEI